MRFIPVVVALATLAACTAAQQNYEPLVDLKASGRTWEEYSADLRECQQLASKRNPVTETAKSTAVGAAAGAATGTVIGAIAGRPAHGLWQGAALGGLAGLGYGLYTSNEAQKEAVMNCLRGRGYVVVGR